MSSVILGALAGWFTGRTLRTGDLAVVDVVLGVAGARLGGVILSVVLESASGRVLFTLVTATARGAVPVWLLQLTVAPSRPSTSKPSVDGDAHTCRMGSNTLMVRA